MDNIQYLLKEINLIREKYQQRLEAEEGFNVFTTLLNQDDERYLHSRFISSLLDPDSPIKMGKLPLELFQECINSNLDFSDTVEVIPNSSYWSEYENIDILIRDKQTKSAIIIENKIYARDSNHENRGQLEGYYQTIINEGYKPDLIEVYYLTLNGHKPSEKSLCTNNRTPELEEKVCCIEYGVEIKTWLELLAKEAYNKPFLRESINQYIKIINNMTGNIDDNELKELVSIIGKTEDNLESARMLINNLKKIYYETLVAFNEEMLSAFKSKKLNVFSSVDDNIIKCITKGGLKQSNLYFHYYIEDNLGLKWTLQGHKGSWDGMYLGLLVKDNKGVSKEIKTKIKSYVKENGLESNEGLYFWKTLNDHNAPYLYFWDFAQEGTDTFNLISPNKRKEIVKKIVDFVIKEFKDLDKFIE